MVDDCAVGPPPPLLWGAMLQGLPHRAHTGLRITRIQKIIGPRVSWRTFCCGFFFLFCFISNIPALLLLLLLLALLLHMFQHTTNRRREAVRCITERPRSVLPTYIKVIVDHPVYSRSWQAFVSYTSVFLLLPPPLAQSTRGEYLFKFFWWLFFQVTCSRVAFAILLVSP